MPPQLSYAQNAIIAQPGMPFDGEVFSQDRVSRILSTRIPFGTHCSDVNGVAVPTQDATTGASFKPAALGILILSPMQEEEDYAPWSIPAAVSGTVTLTQNSTAITFSAAQSFPAGTTFVFSDSPGVPYFLSKTIAAATAAVLTTPYLGAGGAGKTTVSSGLASVAPGLKAGRVGAFMRKGRIWVAGDGGGTALLTGAAINLVHSSTGANPQGVFTFTAVQTTVGNEIDVAPGCVVWQPNGSGSTGATVSSTDSMGNTFVTYPVEINV